jgi:O-antigen biosynthesis protein WbqP
MYKGVIKRYLDVFLSLLAAFVFCLVLIVIGVAIKLDSKGPILFKQKRIGLGKGTFYLYKFRTMRIDTPRDMPTHLLTNPDAFITKVGQFLRQTSLDELPQLYNIIIGEMSIVGPRPALWNQEDLVAERDKYGANDVRPGLTGWAQVNGRDELAIPVKASFDGVYIEKLSFAMDVKCILLTVMKVLNREGIKS